MGTYNLTWVTSPRQDRGLARLLNAKNLDLLNTAISAGTAINAAGSGYAVGNVLTIADSGTVIRATTLTVTSVNGTGGVTGVSVLRFGNQTSYQNAANHSTTVAPAGGSGCVIRCNFYSSIEDMLTRNGGILDGAATSYAVQYDNENSNAVTSGIPNATPAQLASIAATLGIIIPD